MKKRRRLMSASVALLAVAGGGVVARYLARPAPPDARTRAVERARTPSGMVYVPGGPFVSGSEDEDDALPSRRVFVPSFYMDRTEVTNADFRRFRPSHPFVPGEGNRPVTNVLYADAAAYARWAGKRLPTEAEWEKAARGTDGRRYPWGNDWDASRVAARVRGTKKTDADTAPLLTKKTGDACSVFAASRLRPVGSAPSGVSVYGCLDMAGNAWEWVQGFYDGNPDQRIIRGGAVGYGERACRAATRSIEGAGVT